MSEIADMICGNFKEEESKFVYRTHAKLVEFFSDCGVELSASGSRASCAKSTLELMFTEHQSDNQLPPAVFREAIKLLMAHEDSTNESPERKEALEILNLSLEREGFVAFYGPDKACYLRNTSLGVEDGKSTNPNRPFTAGEIIRREALIAYLDTASEDQLIEEVLLRLFRQLGFQRITAAGHKDKALEYGKDLWMKFVLPTQNTLYFGLQVKKDKLDSSGFTKPQHANIGEVYNQVNMMLGHEIFDPDVNKRALVDHAFIIAGGEITKAARNWLAQRLDATKRSQILFLDRDDILNLYTVSNLPLPKVKAQSPEIIGDENLPF